MAVVQDELFGGFRGGRDRAGTGGGAGQSVHEGGPAQQSGAFGGRRVGRGTGAGPGPAAVALGLECEHLVQLAAQARCVGVRLVQGRDVDALAVVRGDVHGHSSWS
ncbi:hypothetical protein [Streptomyces flaveolus]|uniref:Uncharacterized protein n=1 Tax=Streptomyces flaveolus TaxID=67297 RepID=A0ABV3AGX7_9ACTN